MGMGREKGRGGVNVSMLIGDGAVQALRAGTGPAPPCHHPIRDPRSALRPSLLWQVMMNDANVVFNSDNLGRYRPSTKEE
jgi:hypothetical protein